MADDLKVMCQIDPVALVRKPDTDGEYKALVYRLKRQTKARPYSRDEFAALVGSGHAFCPVFDGKGAGADNVVSQQVFCVDVDNERNFPDGRKEPLSKALMLTPSRAFDLAAGVGYPLDFAYLTYNDTEEHPRLRVGWFTPEPVEDAAARRKLINTLMEPFWVYADTACGNLDRFFFGTTTGVSLFSGDAKC